jgi:hypothetical protein
MATQDIYTGSGDGYVYRANQNSWAEARDTTDGASSATTGSSATFKNSYLTAKYFVGRIFLPFTIPAGIVVDSASIKLFTTGSLGTFTESVHVFESTQASPTALALSDFHKFGSVPFADPVNVSMTSVAPDNYCTISLNSAGLNYLTNKSGGVATLAFLGGHDVSNTAPDSAYGAAIGMVEHATPGFHPVMTITYHDAPVVKHGLKNPFGLLRYFGWRI